MMKRFMTLSMLALAMSLCLTSCGGDDDDAPASQNTIQLSTATVAVDGAGGSTTVNVTTDHEWGTSVSDTWLTVSPASSVARSATITITAEANPKPQERTATVTLMAGTARATITVRQSAGTYVEPTIKCPVEGYELVWNDEFDQGTQLGRDWTHEVQPAGWVNNELQTYVNRMSPSGELVTEVSNGTLKINCFKENGKIYSGRVYAKVNTGWKYGYFEASIKLPKGKGTWPAFWMMPVGNNYSTNPWPGCGEIDIMEEVGVDANYVSATVHCNKYNNTNTAIEHATVYAATAESEFHVYGCEWTADYLAFYVDGRQILKYQNDGSGRDQWPFTYAFYPILNLAWGGAWGGYKGVDDSALPVTMEVEYVRVFQKP